MTDRPLVSLAVPLHRSAPFLDDIVANLEAIAFDDVEILVSDRTGADDAWHRLRTRFGRDRRFRFLRRPDRVGWVRHYEELRLVARGKFLRWMPHDDLFEVCDLARLVAALEADPSAVVAYGPTRATDLEGRPLPELDQPDPNPVGPDEPWTLDVSLDLIWQGTCNGAFKGLFHHQRLSGLGVRLRDTRDSIHAERAWLFGASLAGRFVVIDDYHYVKRYHPDSTHAGWQERPVHVLSLGRTMLAHLHAVRGLRGLAVGAPRIVRDSVARAREVAR